jgi:hypothetical protein
MTNFVDKIIAKRFIVLSLGDTTHHLASKNTTYLNYSSSVNIDSPLVIAGCLHHQIDFFVLHTDFFVSLLGA